jgi:hypothetical protein
MIEGNGFTIKQSKFDYFFGRVTSSPNNKARSIQNLEDLKKLGIDEAADGQSILMQIFEYGLNAQEIKRKVNEYGITIIKEVEVAGGEVKGVIQIGYFYPIGNLSTIPEVTTIIPKISNQD